MRWPTMAIAAALVVALGAAGAPDARAQPAWHSCKDGLGADCARVRVPLDRSGALPGSIRLRVARMPGPDAGPTVVYLSGGPGGGGVDELESVLWSVSGLTMSSRVVTFDQRGTGRSGLLRCPRLERDERLRSTSAAADCARRLGPARSHYTTADSVEDLEAIRRALGVEKLTLFGISYGTELALAYARAHPGNVARLALDSVVDPDDGDPFALAGFRAIGPTLAALCPARCRGVSADPVADLAHLTARLRRAPLRGSVVDAQGRAHARTLTPLTVADLLYDADYDPALRAGIPAGVRAALAGDASPLLRLGAVGDTFNAPVPAAVFSSARYAAICEEAPLPWDATTPIAGRLAEARRRAAALGPAAFRPFDFATAAADEIDLCLRWPGVPTAAHAPRAPYPDVPALLLQGGEDLRTPPEESARVAAELPGATRVVVPGVGHATVAADPSSCAATKLLRFLAGKAVGGDCPRVPTGVPAVVPPPVRLADVTPLARGRGGHVLPRRVRRTAAAVGLTLDDVRFALSPALSGVVGGGLRGGRYHLGAHGLVLDGYEAVDGLRISGRWHGRWLRLRLRVRVAGSAGSAGSAGGTLAVRRTGAFRGVLGGHRVRGRLPHRPPRPSTRGGIARVSGVAAVQ